ncbi:Crp/Fnr family transcriptional regulator [Rhizobium sp. BK251]|uniref:Crp/Fnr family transcriptional regulator n=1 Tax=Rhizobium sp. BK251 TaxID=2512125 RepID=UPI0010D992F4|nr:Crp/Fnr family transcriptional regulator [Rhizobium sp. BK251]TCL66339.1 CRP-like cAMP-binding protein [Rhizobium sp. BK251]
MDAISCRSDNFLLGAMDGDALDFIRPSLERVTLGRSSILLKPSTSADYCYFPVSGLASIVISSRSGNSSEVGIVGREGVIPIAPLCESGRSPFKILMQIEGDAYRVRLRTLVELARSNNSARSLFNQYAQSFLLQAAYTALGNAIQTIEERLARWILMCQDRLRDERIPVTHEFLSLMLSVRRPSVTVALHALEGRRLIRSERNLVAVRSRSGLEAFASDSYGLAEQEYCRLIGEFR